MEYRGGPHVQVDPREAQAFRTLPLGGVPAVARALTRTQGQYLAYIHCYTLVHRRPPSENEIADFFSVRGPSAHRMILELEGRGYLSRTPGQPRTLRVLLSRESLPVLEKR
jgi:DNA-binding MarR family transcriptional regulator